MAVLKEFFNGGTTRAARYGSIAGSLSAIGVGLLMVYVAIRAVMAS